MLFRSNISGISHSFFDTSTTSATVTLNWTNPSTPEFGLKYYRIYSPQFDFTVNGVAQSSPARDLTASSNSIIIPADWVGDRMFTLYVVDNLSRQSTGTIHNITKLKPDAPTNFYPQVIDNTVMLTWTAPDPTTLPVSHYIIKEGSSWSTGRNLGRSEEHTSELQSH